MLKQQREPTSQIYYRFPELKEAGIVNNRVTLRRWVEKGYFPFPVRLGPNSVAWVADEVDQWVRDRAEEREHTSAA